MESTLSYRAGSSRLEMFRQKTVSRHTSAAQSTGDNHIGKIKDKDNDLYAQGKQSKNMDDFGISGWPGRRNCQQQQGGWSSQVGRESKTQERDRSPKTSTGLNPPGRHIFGSFRRSAPLCFHISSGCHSTGLIWDCWFFMGIICTQFSCVFLQIQFNQLILISGANGLSFHTSNKHWSQV